MAFTSAPETQTYGTHRVPLVHDLVLAPNAAFIASLILSGCDNVVPFKDSQGNLYGDTRNPIRGTVVTTGSTNMVRGMYVWEKTVGTNYYFVVISDGTNSKVWSATSSTGPFTAVNTITEATTPVRFTEFIDDTNVKKLVMVDGTAGYVFTSNAAGTQIVDADFPTPHVPFPVFLDGYLFLAKTGTGDIYNSDLNDPAAWTAGNYISTEVFPDDIQALVKVNNYLLAVGTQSCEYFYDAANATGSPMARYEGSTLPFGTPYPNSIAASKNTIMMLANNNDGELCFKLIEDFKHTEVPAMAVLQILQRKINTGTVTPDTVRACWVRQTGNLLYVFNFNGNDRTSAANSVNNTPVFSTQAQVWCTFSYNNDGKSFPAYFSSPQTSNASGTFVAGHSGAGIPFFGNYTVINVDDNITGTNISIVQTMTTPAQDFGTLNRKFMSRCGIYYTSGTDATEPRLAWGELTRSSYGNNASNISEAWFKASAVVSPGPPYPFVNQLGSFRSRWFIITEVNAVRCRWYWLEVDINKGQQ